MTAKELKGKVIKGVGGRFKVLCDGRVLNCCARGKIHIEEKIVVGDEVCLTNNKGVFVIDSILPRKNHLIRPPVANIDMLLIIIAPLPATDWTLVDKLLVFAAEYNITPVLCYNKVDITDEEIHYARKVYGRLADIVAVSALTGEGLDVLRSKLKGVVCLAGQSAVGKSSLLNIFCGVNQEIGDLSKIERGRNTTRQVQIFPMQNDLMLIDTCGFSLLDLEGIKAEELMLYYPDFLEQKRCRYNMCTHTAEPDCEVKKAVCNGELDESRYNRYLNIYYELMDKRRDSQ